VNLLPSAEQEEIVTSSASFLGTNLPAARVRALVAEPENVDAGVWRSCGDLGWFALGLPEGAGGVGGSLADEVLLVREIGRSLATGPYVATVLGARVATLGGAPDLAAAIVAGASRVALAVIDHETQVAAEHVTGSLQLLDALGAEHALVATPDVALLISTADLRDGAEHPCIDEATRLTVGRVDAASAVAVVPAGSDAVYRRGLVLTAAMLVGIAEATRDLAAEHATSRVQFDRPIGVNQGVKHPCADMAVRAEAAGAQTVFAALAHDEGRRDADDHAGSAWLVAADAAERNAAAALQVLGGMGFTFEHDVNLYVKRTHVLIHGLADRRTVLDRLLARP
jgi:alkylation response protein AidB-like acyl-CoA dehydrogenase